MGLQNVWRGSRRLRAAVPLVVGALFLLHITLDLGKRECPTPELVYGADGLARLNHDAVTTHPIDVLIQRGNEQWEALQRRQSKTLEAAVAEYKRRYQRPPPAGFEKWFAFTQENDVKIIDDYDQIEKDVQLWFGVRPEEFRKRIKALADLTHTYKITLGPNNVSLSGDTAGDTRAKAHLGLLAPLAPILPNEVSMVISNHDQGSFIVSDELRSELLAHARAGTYVSDDEMRRLEDPEGKTLVAACPSDSAARSNTVGWGEEAQTSFVHDPRPKMNFCDAPELMDLHGAFTWHHKRGSSLRPLFQQSKPPQNAEFLLTPLEAVYNATETNVMTSTWAEKTRHKVFWRGQATGDFYTSNERRAGYDWRRSHRPRWHLFANEQVGRADVLVQDEQGVWNRKSIPKKKLNEKYFDAGIVGVPKQCKEEDGTCQEMNRMGFKDRVDPRVSHQYAYAFDIDGNGWSSRLQRLLASGSVVLKTTIYPEWFSDWLTPWVHYVPVQTDLSDMYDIMSYFIGGPSSKGNDEAARRIAEAGTAFARTHWRWQDMQAYMLRLLLEYGRLAADDRVAASYIV